MLSLIAKLVLPQMMVPSEAAVSLAREFDARDQPKFACSFAPVPAQLGFSMMHWAGFSMSIPLKQFKGTGVDLGVAVEVTPEGGKAVYLGERMQVPAETAELRLPKDAEIRYLGGYFLGPGRYRVRAIALAPGRACRKEWSVKIRAGHEPLALEPNQVTAVGGQRWKGLPGGEPKRRVTVIVEAAPVFPRRSMVRLSSYDRSLLLTALTTMLDNAGFTHATVIAADSRNRKVVFSAKDFGPRELRRLGRAMGEINLGVVSMQTLQGPGLETFFETVLSAADESIRQSEAVVLIGPAWSWQGKLTPRLRETGSAYPPVHYLALSRFLAFDDNLLARFAKASNGSARQVFTAADLAKAIERIGRK